MRARPALRSLPNLISFSRFLLAAGFVLWDAPIARAVIATAAAASDFLDGWIARRVNAASRWGALVDPIADRMFVLVAVAVMLFDGLLSTGAYFVLISRDLATAVGFLVARAVPWLRPVEFRARWMGKVATGLQFLAILAALLAPRALQAIIVMVGVASALAIVDYTWALWSSRDRGPAGSVAER